MLLQVRLARKANPGDIIVALGYSGWGAGQLEHELAQNAWLTVPRSPAHPFELPLRGASAVGAGIARRRFSWPTCRKWPGMPDAPVRQTGTILAFDFGVKRIGVAVGEWRWRRASADDDRGEANAERFAAIEAFDQGMAHPVSLVVGLPVRRWQCAR